jgi:DNA-binding response OmpR family regulator
MEPRLVIVEKDKHRLAEISAVLKKKGFNVQGTDTEQGIFELIYQFKPSAVLLDIDTPTLQGSLLKRAIRAHVRTEKVPVHIFSTTFRLEDFSTSDV